MASLLGNVFQRHQGEFILGSCSICHAMYGLIIYTSVSSKECLEGHNGSSFFSVPQVPRTVPSPYLMLGKCLQKGSVDWGSAHKFHPTSWLHTPADSQPSLSLVVPSLNLFPCRTEEGRNEQALTSSPSMIYLVGELAVTVPAEAVGYQVAGTPDGEDS